MLWPRATFTGRFSGRATRRAPWPFKLVDVYAATIPAFPHKPGLHVYYSEKTPQIKDGLPKFKDFPTAFGGSGEEVPE